MNMKVQELRQLLQTAERDRLEKAFVESYKQFSKQKKEEIDLLITGILEGRDAKPSARKESMDFGTLQSQITTFIENAYTQNYFAPNRVIPKNMRPKWRFLVKNFIKELEKIPTESENYAQALTLLMDLYRLICYACNYYLFSTDDPFRSIGWAQDDLFQLVVRKFFASGYTKENISLLIKNACTGGLSSECLHIQMQMILLGELRTTDVKYMAIEEAMKLVENTKEKLPKAKKSSSQAYFLADAVNEFCAMILLLSVSLAEPEDGVKYYFQNSQERNPEITLYRVLRLIDIMDDSDAWIYAYEYGVKKRKIKPREELADEYKKRTQEDS